MADISIITLPSGSSYNLKDADARASIEKLKSNLGSLGNYRGVTTTELTDGATTSPISVKDGDSTVQVTPSNPGDWVVDSSNVSYIWTGSQWDQIGSAGALKSLAYKDSASGSYTPSGTVTVSSVGTQATITSSFTPKGTVSGSVTPKGSNASSSVTITPTTTSVYSMTSEGSVTKGTVPSCTLPSLTTSVSGETLTLGWSAGSFSAGTATSVTLPTRSQVTNLWNGVSAATAAAQTFTGASSAVSATFTGTAGSATATYTPVVTSTGTFKGTAATVTVK